MRLNFLKLNRNFLENPSRLSLCVSFPRYGKFVISNYWIRYHLVTSVWENVFNRSKAKKIISRKFESRSIFAKFVYVEWFKRIFYHGFRCIYHLVRQFNTRRIITNSTCLFRDTEYFHQISQRSSAREACLPSWRLFIYLFFI